MNRTFKYSRGRKRICPSCGSSEGWTTIKVEGGNAYVCTTKVECSKCDGSLYAGETNEERLACRLMEMKCPQCRGTGKVNCGHEVTNTNLPPIIPRRG